jgi:hypothetical protein
MTPMEGDVRGVTLPRRCVWQWADAIMPTWSESR